MPRYTCRCEACEGLFNVAHSIKKTLTKCGECDGALIRVPSTPYIFSSEPVGEADISTRVNKHISEAKEELEITKKQSQKEYK